RDRWGGAPAPVRPPGRPDADFCRVSAKDQPAAPGPRAHAPGLSARTSAGCFPRPGCAFCPWTSPRAVVGEHGSMRDEGRRSAHMPPHDVVECVIYSSQAARGENVQVEHPICGWYSSAFPSTPHWPACGFVKLLRLRRQEARGCLFLVLPTL